MLLQEIVLGIVLLASSATANWCGAGKPSEETLEAIRGLREAERTESFSLSRRGVASINVPVYMHAVVNSTNKATVLNKAALQKQFDVIVNRFASHNITFTLKGTDRVVDDDLAKGYSNQNWPGHLFHTRKGDYKTLNIWYVTNMDPSIGGSCSVPSGIALPGSVARMLDGCTLQSYSLPGTKFNGVTYTGEISVHEVGHWFGLLHTFEGESCTGDGDYIDDTPAERSYEFMACPTGKDTCPDQPGLDPIDNFMDYSGNGCWKRFTPGQKTRMHNTWFNFRVPSN